MSDLTSKTSLTERLRHAEKFESDFDAVDDLLLAAADEIDRLERDLAAVRLLLNANFRITTGS